VQNVATHEAGHVVGLDDLYDIGYSGLTMYGYVSYKETMKISLEAGDIAGAQSLWGAPA
jgi:bacillopeptidase F (M6 metalloprotease family)